jgi:carbon starvation protein
LGFVVVKALGGEEVNCVAGTKISAPDGPAIGVTQKEKNTLITFPGGCTLTYPEVSTPVKRMESFRILAPGQISTVSPDFTLPAGCVELVPGSSWGLFTIAATIPIALLVGFYMYRIRPGRILEASLLGAALVIAATIAGAWIPGSPLESWFSLDKTQTIWVLCIYGFIASVLPVWMLLCPRDYISSFLKIGTIALLVIGTMIANPSLQHPPINPVFQQSGPTFPGHLFPFVFICIMCGAISGFHALVASGTTPKMIDKESQVRMIGYGAMLMEGLVGVVALIAAAALPVHLYYDINIDPAQVAKYQPKLMELYQDLGLTQPVVQNPLHQTQVESVQHLNLAQVEEMVGGEALRGRTGGAVTLAVSMALIFTKALEWTALPVKEIVKYWYHFAIMFEALFILTTIDAGTRVGRFILQDALAKLIPKFGETKWLPGSLLTTLIVTAGWGWLIAAGSIQTIWPMFGIANQLLAVAALAVVTSMIINRGKLRYAWVTLAPMIFVTATTMTAGAILSDRFIQSIRDGEAKGNSVIVFNGWLNLSLTIFVVASVGLFLLLSLGRWVTVIANRNRAAQSG